MDLQDTKKRIEEAYKLLAKESTSLEKFESIRTLIKGLNPRLDALLENTSKALSNIEKLKKGDIIVLSAESLPENSPEEKKRKQTIIFLINSWRQLQSEVKRISLELEHMKGNNENNAAIPVDKIASAGRITSVAKGPFGIITLGALIIVGASFFFAGKSNNTPIQQSKTEVLPAHTTPSTVSKIQVIIFNGKKLPVKELHTDSGPECTSLGTEAPHYHALRNSIVKAIDGTMVEDPGGCGFGKVKETEIVDVE